MILKNHHKDLLNRLTYSSRNHKSFTHGDMNSQLSIHYDRYLREMEQHGLVISIESKGDIMWRAARSIGPVSVEHCHWAGSYLDGSEADIILMSSAPDLLLELQKCRDLLSTVETCSRNNFENLAHEQIQEIDVVIALATRGEKC